MTKPPRMRFNPHALAELREARGATKTEMAVALKISIQYYCDLESGHRGGTPALITKASEFLKVRPLALISDPSAAVPA